MLGEDATTLDDDEPATLAFHKAYQLDSTHLPSLLGLAASYYRASNWEKAFKFYQMLLVHHRDSLGSDEITDIFYRLGVIKREQGERRKALNMFDKALEEDELASASGSRAALDRLAAQVDALPPRLGEHVR